MAYIERAYLTEQFEDLFHNDNVMNPVMKVLDALEIIDTAPSADVVEVVRCGQCKHWKINPNNLYGGQCRFSECASIDHFCSRGERKEHKGGVKNG